MLQINSTKLFPNMSCAHAQWFDTNGDGTPGKCAALHGYARSTRMTFSGEVDDHGWLFPFGELKAVRAFLEYYFDHTVLLPADDSRVTPEVLENPLLATYRILPYGVSMEMSSLFIWEHVNPYIRNVTQGRAYLSKVECWEHEWNSAFVEVSEETSKSQGRQYFKKWHDNKLNLPEYMDTLLPKKNKWNWTSPKEALVLINGK